MKNLFVGFKGQYNALSILVKALSENNYLLTNSFIGVKRNIEAIDAHFDMIYMFGIDKKLKDRVRIDQVAERDGVRVSTNIDIEYLNHRMYSNGLESYISDNPTHYLCNEAYWYALKKSGGKAVFIHIPPMKYMNEEFIERFKKALK